MASPESVQIRARFANEGERVDVPLAVQREEWEAAAAQAQLPPGIVVEQVTIEGLPGEWVGNAGAEPGQVLFFLHGGGYSSGSCVTHRELAAYLCIAAGVRVFLLNYRLVPEHSFPAAIEDAVTGYRWLLGQGFQPGQVVIGGDSAGGGLAMATLLKLRDQDLALPAAGVLLSPWVDLALNGSTLQSRTGRDPLVSVAGLAAAAALYAGTADRMHPLLSPLYADLRGLPPLLIQVGDDELLLSDATRLAERAQAAGVPVTLEVWEAMWHVWQSFAATLPEAREAIEHIGRYIREQLSVSAGQENR